MILADFLVEQWLNPMDSKAEHNFWHQLRQGFDYGRTFQSDRTG